MWRFESDATLGAAIEGTIGGSFPANVEEFVLGRVNEGLPEDKRDALVIKSIIKQVRAKQQAVSSGFVLLYCVEVFCE